MAADNGWNFAKHHFFAKLDRHVAVHGSAADGNIFEFARVFVAVGPHEASGERQLHAAVAAEVRRNRRRCAPQWPTEDLGVDCHGLALRMNVSTNPQANVVVAAGVPATMAGAA
jgi:hypothetical protein